MKTKDIDCGMRSGLLFLAVAFVAVVMPAHAQSPLSDLPSDYACDRVTALANAPRTPPFVAQYPSLSSDWTLSKEQWQVEIAGQRQTLNVVIAKPTNAIPLRGIVIDGHGHSASQATQDPMAMASPTLVSEMTRRGLIVFFVARRGNFGSTGERLLTLTPEQLSQYYSGALLYADLESLLIRYQSDSLVAAMDQKIANDPQYRPLLGTVLLIGGSGGANTVLQTAADSSVFRAATSKAIIRFTGLDSAFDTNPDALPGVSQFAARLAPALVPSLWLGGEADTTTSPSQLSCMFNAFQRAASYPNTFYLIPDVGHFPTSVVFSQSVLPITTQYLISRGIYVQTGDTSSGTPDLNQHGLTGSYYEPATGGQGVEIEVFPDLSAPGTGLVFVSWFTYDTVVGGAERQRWYTLAGPVVTGQRSAALTIYRNVGGNFNAPPIMQSAPVGTATLTFANCTSGELSYIFTDGTGRTGTIPLTRLTQNVTCSTTTARPTNADFALSGNWYDPATSGQGLTIDVNPGSNTVFAAWYTYAPNGVGAGASGQRWYTAQPTGFTPGTRSIPVTLYQTTGGVFDQTAPAPQTVPVGSGTLAFQNCSAATFSYNFTGGSNSGLSGTINLSRVGPVPPGCAS